MTARTKRKERNKEHGSVPLSSFVRLTPALRSFFTHLLFRFTHCRSFFARIIGVDYKLLGSFVGAPGSFSMSLLLSSRVSSFLGSFIRP